MDVFLISVFVLWEAGVNIDNYPMGISGWSGNRGEVQDPAKRKMGTVVIQSNNSFERLASLRQSCIFEQL